MSGEYSIAAWFGRELAEDLSNKIQKAHPAFSSKDFVQSISDVVHGQAYSKRLSIFSACLRDYLPDDYNESLNILMSILGDENPKETGMFKNYYWVLPIGRFISDFGLEYYESSMQAIMEITKRGTGEYAIRPFIEHYPVETVQVLKSWATSPNFHVRRLASEGPRPKLPWASRLKTFDENPYPIFEILEILKEDEIKFVKTSVANHITDWLKIDMDKTRDFISPWRTSHNIHTQWILKRATRKIDPFVI